MTETKYRHISKKTLSTKNGKYISNVICNMKYRWYTIIFWVLLDQFKLFFNIYFFTISLTQCFEIFAVSPPVASLGPWFLVYFISLLKEGYDDYKRNSRDYTINNQMYITYKNGIFYKKKSSEIEVGDLIILESNQRVPADMVILKTADTSGELFIRTDQLDGETDWKLRSAVPSMQKLDFKCIEDINILVEEPNKDIYSFKGTISKEEFCKEMIENVNIQKPPQVRLYSKACNLLRRNKIKEIIQIPVSKHVNWLISGILEYDLDLETSVNDRSREKEGIIQNEIEIKYDSEIINSANINTSEIKPEIKTEGLSLENTLWMNTSVVTCSTLGCVIYTGNDTKAIMNTSKPRNKYGRFDLELNMYGKIIGGLCGLVAGLFAYMKGFNSHFFVTYVKFIFLFSSAIPISLKVTIEMARYVYSYYVTYDDRIPNTIVRTSSLPEELGRISYFLTDKTGTLTKNEMEMRKIHLGTLCYTQDDNEEIAKSLAKILSNKEKDGVFQRNKKDINNRLYELVECLCVCHNVTPVINGNKMAYQASSPDEVAIVKWTEGVGMKLYRRDRKTMTILDSLNDEQVYEILYMFPFTSESKRMGIIVRHKGQITFYLKGADVVMNKIICHTDWVEEETENMARDGLRTLVIAKKCLAEDEFRKFEVEYQKARTSLDKRNEKIENAISSIERNMSILGITGVEDMLQDSVKITLENLKNGGLKIWMLTGDKIETAISIAVSSRIFDRDTEYKILSNTTDPSILRLFLNTLDTDAIVVDGVSLKIIMETCFDLFIDKAMSLKTLIGCRFSPTQKALVARALKIRSKKIVCCIGDGGNDVSMITEANIGVGIVGKEGNQASLAADYSIEKFCYVTDLFYWHGRNSYKNSATIANLIIHRGTVLSVLRALFCALINFIPFSLYSGVIMVAYISCYTFFPIFSSVFSTDVSREVIEKFPELYKELVDRPLLSSQEFATWNFMSFTQGTIIIFVMVSCFKKELFSISTLTFSSLIVNEIFMVFLANNRINKQIALACGFSVLLYLLSFFILGDILYIDMPFYIFIPKVLCANFIAIIPKLLEIAISLYKPSTSKKLEYDV